MLDENNHIPSFVPMFWAKTDGFFPESKTVVGSIIFSNVLDKGVMLK